MAEQLTNLRQIEAALGLPPGEAEAQDWGVVCADAGRIDVFASFIVEHGMEVQEDLRPSLLELLLASVEELLEDEMQAGMDRDAVFTHVERVLALWGPDTQRMDLVRRYWIEHFDALAQVRGDERCRRLAGMLQAWGGGE